MIGFIRAGLAAVITAATVAVTIGASGPPPVVDGFTVGHVPAGVGQQVSTFTYHWEDVTFRSQVWERGPDAEGAFAVDLTVKTLRGAPLTDVAALREFLAGYHEQDPSTWREIEPGVAYLRPGAVFRFVGPGVATEVSLDGTRFDEAELLATARALTPAQPGSTVVPRRCDS